jgi:hypothetical protein
MSLLQCVPLPVRAADAMIASMLHRCGGYTMSNRELYEDAEAALDMVLEEVEKVIDSINQEGAEAFQKSHLDDVRHLTDQSSQVQAFLKKVQDLQDEWSNLSPTDVLPDIEPSKQAVQPLPTPRSYGKRLPRGLRTPEIDFFTPILRVVVKMGGKGQASEVLSQVGEIMKPRLNECDFETLLSGQHDPRWYKTAQWARRRMVQRGLLSSTSESSRGIWEITESGKQYLARNV